ncbi:MAG TPA: HIT family protein [Candidatus Paceibacterota bacterium]|nr:HIT family protein [Candidatus Paceibacterota bacterium]HRS47957.1 HIT family protein [Candidatus Paceibacterota bacterium]
MTIKQQCIFCKIIKNEIPVIKVYETSKNLAFLDINPLTIGHSLIIPKKHAENIFDISPDDFKALMIDAQKLAKILKISLKAQGINLINSSGEIAGQSVFHFHFHLIPRYKNDKLEFSDWWNKKTKKINNQELFKIAQKITKNK